MNGTRITLGYRILHPYIGWVYTRLYSRTFEVVGHEGVPSDRPLVFVTTHQNNLLDALSVLFATDRRPVFAARADLFRTPRTDRALRFLRILPMYRADHGRRAIADRLPETMGQLRDHLVGGGSCAIMAEGSSVPARSVRRLKKGWARLVLDALPDAPDLLVIPVAIDYSDWYRWGPDQRVTFGEPLSFDLANDDVPRRLNEMNEAVHAALSALVRGDEEVEAWHRTISTRRRWRDALWRVLGLPALLVATALLAPVLLLTQRKVRRHRRPDFKSTLEFGILTLVSPVWLLLVGLLVWATLGTAAFAVGGAALPLVLWAGSRSAIAWTVR